MDEKTLSEAHDLHNEIKRLSQIVEAWEKQECPPEPNFSGFLVPEGTLFDHDPDAWLVYRRACLTKILGRLDEKKARFKAL